MDEVPLAGGSVASSVVRVGDSVRRATERWSPAVHALLVHLEAVAVAGSPRFLGLDHQGREILTWIDGTPATKPWPAPLLAENGVRRLARLFAATTRQSQPSHRRPTRIGRPECEASSRATSSFTA